MPHQPLLSARECEQIENAIKQMAALTLLQDEKLVTHYIKSTRAITDGAPDPVLPRLLSLNDIDAMQRKSQYFIRMAELMVAMQQATKQIHDAMLNRGVS